MGKKGAGEVPKTTAGAAVAEKWAAAGAAATAAAGKRAAAGAAATGKRVVAGTVLHRETTILIGVAISFVGLNLGVQGAILIGY